MSLGGTGADADGFDDDFALAASLLRFDLPERARLLREIPLAFDDDDNPPRFDDVSDAEDDNPPRFNASAAVDFSTDLLRRGGL